MRIKGKSAAIYSSGTDPYITMATAGKNFSDKVLKTVIVNSITIIALWDTGATMSFISQRSANK